MISGSVRTDSSDLGILQRNSAPGHVSDLSLVNGSEGGGGGGDISN